MEKQLVTNNLFPDILICQTPGYHLEKLKENGYPSSFWFSLGKNSHGHFVGWNGNKGQASTDILDEIAMIKNDSIRPKATWKMRQNKEYIL